MAAARKLFFLLAGASLLAGVSCRREGLPSSVMDQVREAHKRWLTVDAYRVFPEEVASSVTDAGGGRLLAGKSPIWPGFRKMREAGLDAVVLMVSGPRFSPTPEGHAKARESAVRSIEAIRLLAADHPDEIGLALTSHDAYRFEKEGKLAVFLGLGDGRALENDPSLVGFFRSLGVTVVALRDDSANDIRDAAADSDTAAIQASPEDRGLSDFGRAVVAECNRLGVVMNVSGFSDKFFFDVLAASEAPVIASHPIGRAIQDDSRNLSDEMVLDLAENGGIVNVCLFPGDQTGPGSPSRLKRPSVDDVADHIGHIRKLVGYDRVGIGSGLSGARGIDGFEGPEGAIDLTVELLRRGFDESELENIWGGNLMRLFDQVLVVAENRSGGRTGPEPGGGIAPVSGRRRAEEARRMK